MSKITNDGLTRSAPAVTGSFIAVPICQQWAIGLIATQRSANPQILTNTRRHRALVTAQTSHPPSLCPPPDFYHGLIQPLSTQHCLVLICNQPVTNTKYGCNAAMQVNSMLVTIKQRWF